ncbi:hypothetical protein [Pseudomonas coleopterorum]|uniref:hypothetical protein n=1 Tax=Pseudomonas coleopterorum TaxID=1605838 RepID=UPI000A739822|nr:hypothetical protein [Pseudomonas coleopterorum]
MTTSDDVVLATATQIQQTFSSAQVAQLIRLISPAAQCALMSPYAFERVIAFMSCRSGHRAYSAKSLHAARLVLVMGASVAEAAADAGLSRQVVHRLMARIQTRLDASPEHLNGIEDSACIAAAAAATGPIESIEPDQALGEGRALAT